MAAIRKLPRRFRCLGCGACFMVALHLFLKELSRESPATVSSRSPERYDSLPETFVSTYQASGDEDEIVSHVTRDVEHLKGKGKFYVEVVDCPLRSWFPTSQCLTLTRSLPNFVADDNFARGVATPRKRTIVFLCYNTTGVFRAELELMASKSKSNSIRRTDVSDLLFVITRSSQSEGDFSAQLPSLPNNFKQMIHVDARFRGDRFFRLKCFKQLLIKMSFGFRMRIEFLERTPIMSGCLSDWSAIDERKKCLSPLSKVQELRRMKFSTRPRPRWLIYASSDHEPCINWTFPIVPNLVNIQNSPRIPVFIDNDMTAHAFDLQVPTSGLRGDVFNMAVMGIMILLGASLWLLSDNPSTDMLFGLLCAVSSNGGCADDLKNKVAVAASMWLLGTWFFSQILLDDMTSSITVPDSSRIRQHRDCAFSEASAHFGKRYVNANAIVWLRVILKGRTLSGDPIICGSSSEIDGLRRMFNHDNLYAIRLETRGQKYAIKPSGAGNYPCPWENAGTKCVPVDSFVDDSEWNDYASIVSRFDLLKHTIRERQRFSWRGNRVQIEATHGCCKSRSNWSKELVDYISRYEPKPSDTSDSLYDFLFLSKFVLVGSCVGLLCFTIECSIPYLTRHCQLQRPPRRVAPG